MVYLLFTNLGLHLPYVSNFRLQSAITIHLSIQNSKMIGENASKCSKHAIFLLKVLVITGCCLNTTIISHLMSLFPVSLTESAVFHSYASGIEGFYTHVRLHQLI